MKTLAFLLAMLVGSIVYAQETVDSSKSSGTIKATVPNLKSDEGQVLFALYTEDNFLMQPSIYPAKSEMHDGKAYAIFENVPAGTYAIVVLHDKNSNKKMDFDSSGMPMEDYGTSGNTMSYGPPNWTDANFDFDGSQKNIDIRL